MCIRKGYITVERAPWLCYALEKRATTLLISVPVVVLGIILAPIEMVISYYLSFYMLRTQTNGFHAKTILKCLVLSLISVGIFMGVLPKVLDGAIEFILVVIAALLIYRLAPYNHPNMALTQEELTACVRSVKRRLKILMSMAFLAHILHFPYLSKGIIEGIIMVAVSLIFAYFVDWKHTKVLL